MVKRWPSTLDRQALTPKHHGWRATPRSSVLIFSSKRQTLVLLSPVSSPIIFVSVGTTRGDYQLWNIHCFIWLVYRVPSELPCPVGTPMGPISICMGPIWVPPFFRRIARLSGNITWTKRRGTPLPYYGDTVSICDSWHRVPVIGYCVVKEAIVSRKGCFYTLLPIEPTIWYRKGIPL
jgi:hypothetical protein